WKRPRGHWRILCGAGWCVTWATRISPRGNRQSSLGIQQRMGFSPLIAAQMYYSLIARDLGNEVVPFCQDVGIGIAVWSPLAGGFLSVRYRRKDPTGGKGRIADFDFIPFDEEKRYDLLEVMRSTGDRHKASVAQIALAWPLTKPDVSTVLVGASKVSQLEDNLGAAEVKISGEKV